MNLSLNISSASAGLTVILPYLLLLLCPHSVRLMNSLYKSRTHSKQSFERNGAKFSIYIWDRGWRRARSGSDVTGASSSVTPSGLEPSMRGESVKFYTRSLLLRFSISSADFVRMLGAPLFLCFTSVDARISLGMVGKLTLSKVFIESSLKLLLCAIS